MPIGILGILLGILGVILGSLLGILGSIDHAERVFPKRQGEYYLLIIFSVIGMLVLRYVRTRQPGRTDVSIPALPPHRHRSASVLSLAFLRHGAFMLFLGGLPFFFVALAAPQAALIQEEQTSPGHRITIRIDASLSMDTAFSTERLRAGNTFLANVAAAEYFVRRRMEGPYRDLVSLVQFGSQAYIVTPFTND